MTDGGDAMALFASKAKQSGGQGGAEETLSKLIGAGHLDKAAEAFKGFADLQSAVSSLTAPIAGISMHIIPSVTSPLGNLLGEQIKFNMNASAGEIIGNEAGGSDVGGGSDNSDHSTASQEQSGESYNPNEDSNLTSAGQKIFSSGSDVEHHEDISYSPPMPTTSAPQQSSGIERD